MLTTGKPSAPRADPAPSSSPSHNMPDLVFVPITHNEAAKGRGAAKRIVRAHVTRVQHAKSSTIIGMDLQAWTVKPYIHKDCSVRRKPKNIVFPETKCTTSRLRGPAKTNRQESSSSTGSEEQVELVLPKLPDNAAEDPFWSFPVKYDPNISPIFAHYIQNIAVDMPDIDGPNAKGLLRRALFPLCMTEAAAMYAVLLMGASHYCIVNPSKARLIDLLALKARALSEINAAIADPEKALTDAMIMAVAKLAAYEAIFGDSSVFSAHMGGLKEMLKRRGGLSMLGLNGLLERMLVWIDLNGCHLTGLTAYPEELCAPQNSMAKENSMNF